MKDTLQPGIRNEKQMMTTPDMSPGHLAGKSSGPGVLSTPAMIGMMERTSLESVVPHLDASEQTVGTMVHVWHRAAAKVGEPVTCRTELIERDRRRLLFKVEVTAGDLKIGDGTHERFVIDTSKFNKKA
jgi:predicted thioesterase